MTDIEIKTRSIYDELSPAEQKVAWYFLQNLGSVFDDPIAVLAEKSGVSQVMWVRFCKALGFSGLKDMKKNLFFQLSQHQLFNAQRVWLRRCKFYAATNQPDDTIGVSFQFFYQALAVNKHRISTSEVPLLYIFQRDRKHILKKQCSWMPLNAHDLNGIRRLVLSTFLCENALKFFNARAAGYRAVFLSRTAK